MESKKADRPIYLDYNATTPVDPRVLEAMLPFLRDTFGNPSSVSHSYGWEASQAVENARKEAAQLIGAKPKEVFWTSGATESNNLAILGVIRPLLKRGEKCHVITTAVEHKAVIDVVEALSDEGAEVTFLKPDRYGRVSVAAVEAELKPHTRLVSIIMGQNEIGSVNPVADIGRSLKSRNILFHTDCAQSAGKLPIDVSTMGIDLLSISGHKIYAPKGIGLLYVRSESPKVEIEPQMFGGSQEKGLRPGTLNVPGIVALGEACRLARTEMEAESKRLTVLRDSFVKQVLETVPSARLNGHPTERLPNNVSFSFTGLSPEAMGLWLSGLAVSSGSACSMGAPSHVLRSIGVPEREALATVRFGLGRGTTANDLQVATEKIRQMVKNNAEND